MDIPLMLSPEYPFTGYLSYKNIITTFKRKDILKFSQKERIRKEKYRQNSYFSFNGK